MRVSNLTAGSNNYSTPSYDVMPYIGELCSDGVITGFGVTAQSTPDMTVAVGAGVALVTATPTSEAERLFRTILSASYNVTIAANTSGSTKYDLVYIKLPAASLQNPPVSGDITETLTLLTERHNASGEALTDTNSLLLAEITVANGATSIAGGAILSRAASAKLLVTGAGTGWDPILETHTYASGTTVTVPAGAKAKYAVGDKYKVDQSIPQTSYFSFDSDNSDAKGVATVTNIGTPTYTAGKHGNALTLNGTNQALAITDAAIFKPTGAFTVACWFKTSVGSTGKFLFISKSKNTNDAGIGLYVSNTNKIKINVGNNTTTAVNTDIVGTTTVTDGAWHRVIWSYQSNFSKIFLDGKLEASGYTVTPVYAATNYVRIGCANDTGTNVVFMNGQIDDFTFVNGFAVDEAWAEADYARGTALTSANLAVTQYFNIISLTDTLLTLTGGADYVLYNGAITNPKYAKGNAVGFPIGFNCTLGATGFSSKTNDTGFLTMVGENKHLYINVYGVSNSAGAINVTLPITPKKNKTILVFRTMDNGLDQSTIGAMNIFSTKACECFKDPQGNAWTASGNKKIEGDIIYQ